MLPVAVDMTSFSEDIARNKLPSADWPRLARDCGCAALDVSLKALVALDPLSSGCMLRGEMGRRGVVLACARDDGAFCTLDAQGAGAMAPLWTTNWWHACRSLSDGGWGAGLVALRPPGASNMATYNTLVRNIERARDVATEWGFSCAITNEESASYGPLTQDVRGLGLCLDADRLPRGGQARARILNEIMPTRRVRLVRIEALGDEEDQRVLPAWAALLRRDGFDGFVSVKYVGDGDRYAGTGRAIALLRGGTDTPRLPAPARQGVKPEGKEKAS